MARAQGPLLSIEATGAIGGNLIFQNQQGIAVIKKFAKPRNPKSSSQESQRANFRYLSDWWQVLPLSLREEWRTYNRSEIKTTKAAFFACNLPRLKAGLPIMVTPNNTPTLSQIQSLFNMPAPFYFYGRNNLIQWDKAIANVAHKSPTICALGDSWMKDSITMPWPSGLLNYNWLMQAGQLIKYRLGNAASGYQTTNTIFLDSPDTIKTVISGWSTQNNNGAGPDCNYRDSVAGANSITFSGWGTKQRIFFMYQTGGGTIGYSMDGDTVRNVSTAADGSHPHGSMGVIEITGYTFGTYATVSAWGKIHVCTITTTGTGVRLYGILWTNEPEPTWQNYSGFTLNRMASYGCTISKMLANTDLPTALQTMNPDLVLLSFGVNESDSELPAAQFADNLRTMIQLVNAACPAASVLFVSQANIRRYPSNLVPAYKISDYVEEIMPLVASHGLGIVDCNKLVPAYTGTDANTPADVRWTNSTHMNHGGHEIFSQAVADYLLLNSGNPFRREYFLYGSGHVGADQAKTICWSVTAAADGHKQYVFRLNDYTQPATPVTIAFEHAFTQTPHVRGDSAIVSKATVTKTTLQLSGTSANTGWLVIEGY